MPTRRSTAVTSTPKRCSSKERARYPNRQRSLWILFRGWLREPTNSEFSRRIADPCELPSWYRRGGAKRRGGRSHTITSEIDRQLSDRVSMADHPVRSFQSRTPLLFQEGSLRARSFGR